MLVETSSQSLIRQGGSVRHMRDEGDSALAVDDDIKD